MQVTDRGIEKIVSIVLRTGVLLSGLIVLLGGVYFLVRHGHEPADYHTFKAQTPSGHYLVEIARGAARLQGRSIIQLGIVCLIATPVMRVIVSLIGFALERDRIYVLITSLVLAILLYSLIAGAGGAA
jgi:uncharacterized membrane protein